jgi:hypothetical protein
MAKKTFVAGQKPVEEFCFGDTVRIKYGGREYPIGKQGVVVGYGYVGQQYRVRFKDECGDDFTDYIPPHELELVPNLTQTTTAP